MNVRIYILYKTSFYFTFEILFICMRSSGEKIVIIFYSDSKICYNVPTIITCIYMLLNRITLLRGMILGTSNTNKNLLLDIKY